MLNFALADYSPTATSTGVPRSSFAPMPHAFRAPFPRGAQFTSAEMRPAFSASVPPVIPAGPVLTNTFGPPTKRTSYQFPKQQLIPPNTDSAPILLRKPRNSQTLFHHLTATHPSQTPSEVSPQKVLTTNHFNSPSLSKTLIFSHSLAGSLK